MPYQIPSFIASIDELNTKHQNRYQSYKRMLTECFERDKDVIIAKAQELEILICTSEFEKDIEMLVTYGGLVSFLEGACVFIDELQVKNSIISSEYFMKIREINSMNVHRDAVRQEIELYDSRYENLKLEKSEEHKRLLILLNEKNARVRDLKITREDIMSKNKVLLTYILGRNIEMEKLFESFDFSKSEEDASAEEIKELKKEIVIVRALNQDAKIWDGLRLSRISLRVAAVVATSSAIFGAGVTAFSLHRLRKR